MSGLLDKGKELLAKTGNHSTSTQGNPGGEDYVDKALDALERKQGMASNRNTNEKITDGARNAFEKVTGHTVSSKISN